MGARSPGPTGHAQAAHLPYLLLLFAFWKILESRANLRHLKNPVGAVHNRDC